MAAVLRRAGWGFVTLVIVIAGCNPATLYYFLNNEESKLPAKVQKLALEDKEKPVKVAIISTKGLGGDGIRELVASADRDLCNEFGRHLAELCTYNKENVKVVTASQIQAYKEHHRDWDHPLDLDKIGEDLEVDYVIHLEIESLSVVPKTTGGLYYEGRAEIETTLVNVKTGDRKNEHFSCNYPEDNYGITMTESPSERQFRVLFLRHCGERLSWFYTAHPTEREFKGGVGK
jgi:hypothetical protein